MNTKITWLSITVPVQSKRKPYVSIHRGGQITTLGHSITPARMEMIDRIIFKQNNELPFALVCAGHISLTYHFPKPEAL